MFGVFKLDAYVCGALSPTDPSPSQVMSDFLGKDVYFVMKGPTNRPCPPTFDYPELQANAVFQVHVSSNADSFTISLIGHFRKDVYPLLIASEESLWAVENAVRRAASRGPTEGGKVPGIDRGRWHDGELQMERYGCSVLRQHSLTHIIPQIPAESCSARGR